MADYQEYRRRVLHRRWRRRFMAAGLLFLLVLLGVVGREDLRWIRGLVRPVDKSGQAGVS